MNTKQLGGFQVFGRRIFCGAIGCTLLIFQGFPACAAGPTERAGDVLQFVLPATAVAITGLHRDREGGIQFLESAATTIAVTYALKYAVNEKRPNGGRQSFPSGHTSISFASAEYLRKRYGWEYGIPTYAAASFVAFSRVESGQHHPQDVIGGAAIGILSSTLFTRRFKSGWKVHADGDLRGFALTAVRDF